MSRGQASILGATLLGTFFSATTAGLLSFSSEVYNSHRTVEDERLSKEYGEHRPAVPPNLLLVSLTATIAGALGAIGGACAVIVPGLFLGRRRESYLLDVLGAVGGICLGLAVAMAAFINETRRQSPSGGREYPWAGSVVGFGLATGGLSGLVIGLLVGAGVRSHVVGNRS